MARWLIALVGVIYAGIAVEMWIKGSPQAIVYGGYAASNVGLWMIAD